MDGVVKLVPVPNKVPPDGASYQFNVPFEAVACNVTLPESQRLAGVVDVIVGTLFTVTITAVLGEVQPFKVVST